ncbi:Iron-sulfur cluster insertion protein ErpA [Candidatus Hepatincolaceae symbiont of Richtersius coronifer]
MDNNPESNFKLSVSAAALSKISEVLKSKSEATFFRIEIKSGGCSGFSTSFKIDDNLQEEDLIIKQEGVKIVINNSLAEFIQTAELHFTKDILSSYFQLNVTTATGTCSCGSSFSV